MFYVSYFQAHAKDRTIYKRLSWTEPLVCLSQSLYYQASIPALLASNHGAFYKQKSSLFIIIIIVSPTVLCILNFM